MEQIEEISMLEHEFQFWKLKNWKEARFLVHSTKPSKKDQESDNDTWISLLLHFSFPVIPYPLPKITVGDVDPFRLWLLQILAFTLSP